MRKSKKLTKKDMEELETNPLKWLCKNIGREIKLDLPKEEYYYLIKTDAKPIEIMDCEHIIGGKRYQGEAVELTKLELKFIYEDTTSFGVKDKIWKVLE